MTSVEKAYVDDLERPQLDRIRRAKAAHDAVAGLREQPCVTRNDPAGRGLALRQVRLESRHGQRRHRIDEVGMENPEQTRADLRQFLIEPVVETRGEKRERLHEPFDVRIGAHADRQLESCRDLGIEMRELLAHPTQVRELVEYWRRNSSRSFIFRPGSAAAPLRLTARRGSRHRVRRSATETRPARSGSRASASPAPSTGGPARLACRPSPRRGDW